MTVTASLEAPPAAAVRAALLLPLAVLGFAALALGIQASLAWGAADIIEFPDWMPTAVGLIIAVPTAIVSIASIRSILRVTRGPISIGFWQAPFPALVLLAIAGMEGALALRLPYEDSYSHLLDENGKPEASPGRASAWPWC